MSRGRFTILAILLGMLSMLGPVNVDPFLPAIPAIAKDFASDTGAVQFSLATLMIGNAIGQLIYGPLSDRFGRKPVMLGALIAYLAAALAASQSSGPETLAFWRFFQGLVSASGRILATAAARDLFAREVLGRFLSYAMMIGAMAAIVSPVLGGFLVLNLGWRAVFFFMATFAAALIVLISLLFKETLTEKNFRALTPHVLSANFRAAIGNRDFKLYVFCGGFILAGLVAFLTSASPVFIGRLGLNPIEFGTLFATISATWLVSTFAAARLVGRFGLNATLFLGTLLATIGGLALAVPVFMGVERTVTVIAPMIVYVIGFGLVFPQSAAGAMSPFPRSAGTTSSLIGFIQNSLGAAMATFLSLTAGDSLTLMATAIAASGIAGLIVAAVIITGAKNADADTGP